jgi:hypothetical protein
MADHMAGVREAKAMLGLNQQNASPLYGPASRGGNGGGSPQSMTRLLR